MSECFLYFSFLFFQLIKQNIIVTNNTSIILNLPVNLINCVINNYHKSEEPKRSNFKKVTVKKGGVFSKSKINQIIL